MHLVCYYSRPLGVEFLKVSRSHVATRGDGGRPTHRPSEIRGRIGDEEHGALPGRGAEDAEAECVDLIRDEARWGRRRGCGSSGVDGEARRGGGQAQQRKQPIGTAARSPPVPGLPGDEQPRLPWDD